ncbi:MAG: globin family protein [Acidobacteriota bacterium]
MTSNVQEASSALKLRLLRESFAAVSPMAGELAARFYETLFDRYPEVRPLFANVRMDEQKKKLIRSIALVIHNLERPGYLEAYLGGLGQMHVAYGVREEHYAAVGECLLAALESVAGRAWTEEVKGAWTDAYGAISAQMISGARRLGS